MAISKNENFVATPPGVTIQEQMANRKMTRAKLAAGMGMTEEHVIKLLDGNLELTPTIAARLESVLGMPARFRGNLESKYRTDLFRMPKENSG
jgi:HTH-type transcriptional regulator/antitoxin HigA